jgi:hypothetical protein
MNKPHTDNILNKETLRNRSENITYTLERNRALDSPSEISVPLGSTDPTGGDKERQG